MTIFAGGGARSCCGARSLGYLDGFLLVELNDIACSVDFDVGDIVFYFADCNGVVGAVNLIFIFFHCWWNELIFFDDRNKEG